MRRYALLLVVLCLTGGLAFVAPSSAASGGTTIAVSNVTTSPTAPVTDEPVTFEATIQNYQGSSDIVSVDRVALVTQGGNSEELTHVKHLGKLPPGASTTVPLVTSFSHSGVHKLRVIVTGENESGATVETQYSVTVNVQNDAPRVDVNVPRSTEGVGTTATVTVANGLDRDLRNVQVTLGGSFVDTQHQQVLSNLPAGKSQTFTFNVTPGTSGSATASAQVTYTLADGPQRSASAQTSVDIRPARSDVTLNVTKGGAATASPNATRGSAGRAVSVTVSNVGNVPVDNVVVHGHSSNASVGQAVVKTLKPGTSQTVQLPISDINGTAKINVRARYTVDDTQKRVPGSTVTVHENPGRINLTGLSTKTEGDHLRISGSASNVGLNDVHSVVVRVLPAKGVTPSPPNRDYFVGTVPASDFVSFDVTAWVDANATSVPLQVTYLANGVQHTETISAPLDQSAPVKGMSGNVGGSGSQASNSGSSSGGLLQGLLLPIVLALVVLAGIVAFVVIAWRNRDDGA